MDQSDQISRRDAVIGLSFLGTLTLALLATVVYRVVDSEPRKPRVHLPSVLASAPSAGGSTELVQLDQGVEPASYQAPSLDGAVNGGAAGSTPTFVAPSERTNSQQ